MRKYIRNYKNKIFMKSVEEISIKIAMQLVCNWSKSTAQRKINQARDALKKSKKSVLSIEEFIEYYEIKNK